MGYYTQYTLEVSGGEGVSEEDYLPYLDPDDEIWMVLKYQHNSDSMKWYEHEADMKEFSAKFPDCLWTLTGEGEEAGDLWVKYFKAGKMQVCKGKITYDPYDPKELK